MNKLLSLFLAAILVTFSLAGNALAFTNGHLIRVVYDTVGAKEYATDLGPWANFTVGTVVGSGGDAITLSTLGAASWSNLKVGYYLIDATTGAHRVSVAGAAGGVTSGSRKFTTYDGAATPLNTMYAAAAGGATSALFPDKKASVTYYVKMDGSGGTPGFYGGWIPASGNPEGTLSLAPLATTGYVDQTIYTWNGVNLGAAGATAGTVAFSVRTRADGSTLILNPPAVTAFTMPSLSTTLTAPVTTFNAIDYFGAVSGYLITESPTAPLASDILWSASVPTSFTFSGAGARTAYAWALDTDGIVSAYRSANVTVDAAAPTVDTFTMPSTATDLTVPVTAFSASDDTGVTGYKITESSTPPLATDAGWSTAAPSSFTFAGVGARTAYAWAKDIAGRVSIVTSLSKANVTIRLAAPIVKTLSTTYGTVGSTVLITGTNLTGATVVKLGTIPVTAFTVNSSTQITATVPSGIASGYFSVTTPGGTGTTTSSTATGKTLFTVIGTPTITSFTPLLGMVGTNVTITGTSLIGATAVSFNGVPATVISSTLTAITTTVPVGATSGLIGVTTPRGTGTSTGVFKILSPLPTVTTLSAVYGSVGSTVVITGTNFTGATAVKFNTTLATVFTVNSDTQITATVPTGATTGKVSVTTPSGAGTGATVYTILGAPAITSFTPVSGMVGTNVTITGTSLLGATAVTFNGVTAPVLSSSLTSISTTVPVGATTGLIRVTTPGGTGTSSGTFTVLPPLPIVTTLSASYGSVGSTVIITGANFTGATAVKFNTTLATGYTVNSDTQITATVPTGATTGKVSVTNPSGTGTGATVYTILGAPAITSFTPVSGMVGTNVTITGTSLLGATVVTFNGVTAPVLSSTLTSITTTVPVGATTGLISVTTPGGTGTSTGTFTVFPPLPTVTTLSTSYGTIGATVIITGTGLTGATSVKFNTTLATAFTVNSDTQITATVPTGATTGKIGVTTPSGAGTGATIYTVIGTPTITSFAPGSGMVGTNVTITGTSLIGATAVTFNGVTAPVITSTLTSITTTVPDGATTGLISVTTPVGSGSSLLSFTVL